MFATQAHIALGWDSLFTYLVKRFGFSEAAAYQKLRVMDSRIRGNDKILVGSLS